MQAICSCHEKTPDCPKRCKGLKGFGVSIVFAREELVAPPSVTVGSPPCVQFAGGR